MKVVLKVTILDRIMKEVFEAKKNNREVDYVVVTPNEYEEMLGNADFRRCVQFARYPFEASGSINDESFKTRDFQSRNRGEYRPTFRAMSRERVNGVDIYVVPLEYPPA